MPLLLISSNLYNQASLHNLSI
uniref:Uncharacterized protein n=1 Tax=Arundo donax TaxID=35708 RepID=A0A0A9FLX8_ARUDO